MGLGDVDLEASGRLNDRGELEVRQTMVNRGKQPRQFPLRALCARPLPPGRPGPRLGSRGGRSGLSPAQGRGAAGQDVVGPRRRGGRPAGAQLPPDGLGGALGVERRATAAAHAPSPFRPASFPSLHGCCLAAIMGAGGEAHWGNVHAVAHDRAAWKRAGGVGSVAAGVCHPGGRCGAGGGRVGRGQRRPLAADAAGPGTEVPRRRRALGGGGVSRPPGRQRDRPAQGQGRAAHLPYRSPAGRPHSPAGERRWKCA